MTIIATAILDALKEQPPHQMGTEEAKIVAKCVVEALADAQLEIVPVQSSNE